MSEQIKHRFEEMKRCLIKQGYYYYLDRIFIAFDRPNYLGIWEILSEEFKNESCKQMVKKVKNYNCLGCGEEANKMYFLGRRN